MVAAVRAAQPRRRADDRRRRAARHRRSLAARANSRRFGAASASCCARARRRTASTSAASRGAEAERRTHPLWPSVGWRTARRCSLSRAMCYRSSRPRSARRRPRVRRARRAGRGGNREANRLAAPAAVEAGGGGDEAAATPVASPLASPLARRSHRRSRRPSRRQEAAIRRRAWLIARSAAAAAPRPRRALLPPRRRQRGDRRRRGRVAPDATSIARRRNPDPFFADSKNAWVGATAGGGAVGGRHPHRDRSERPRRSAAGVSRRRRSEIWCVGSSSAAEERGGGGACAASRRASCSSLPTCRSCRRGAERRPPPRRDHRRCRRAAAGGAAEKVGVYFGSSAAPQLLVLSFGAARAPAQLWMAGLACTCAAGLRPPRRQLVRESAARELSAGAGRRAVRRLLPARARTARPPAYQHRSRTSSSRLAEWRLDANSTKAYPCPHVPGMHSESRSKLHRALRPRAACGRGPSRAARPTQEGRRRSRRCTSLRIASSRRRPSKLDVGDSGTPGAPRTEWRSARGGPQPRGRRTEQKSESSRAPRAASRGGGPTRSLLRRCSGGADPASASRLATRPPRVDRRQIRQAAVDPTSTRARSSSSTTRARAPRHARIELVRRRSTSSRRGRRCDEFCV